MGGRWATRGSRNGVGENYCGRQAASKGRPLANPRECRGGSTRGDRRWLDRSGGSDGRPHCVPQNRRGLAVAPGALEDEIQGLDPRGFGPQEENGTEAEQGLSQVRKYGNDTCAD